MEENGTAETAYTLQDLCCCGRDGTTGSRLTTATALSRYRT